MAKMTVRQVEVGTLKHPDYNARQRSKKDFEQLKRSLSEFDAVEPAVVNMHKGRENIIVGGNQRVRAAKALKWKSFPCVFVDLTLKREKELNIRLNRNAGEWDFDALADHFDLEELVEYGFDEKELTGAGGGGNEEPPEVEFSQELLLEHNYVVLYFDDPMDWQVATEKFGLKTVRDLIPRKSQPTGIGRVLRGAEWLERIQ